ncbi:hypothetical protein PM082_006165 [Marasmius tenuissimus]|nr:hypothetical protein PM082_006165 [Marasmius tenuissimus]
MNTDSEGPSNTTDTQPVKGVNSQGDLQVQGTQYDREKGPTLIGASTDDVANNRQRVDTKFRGTESRSYPEQWWDPYCERDNTSDDISKVISNNTSDIGITEEFFVSLSPPGSRSFMEKPTIFNVLTETPIAIAEHSWESRCGCLAGRRVLKNGLTR